MNRGPLGGGHTNWLREVVALDQRWFVLTGRRCRSRPVRRESSPLGTFVTGRSNEWPVRWAKARSPSVLSTAI